jgi:TolA-binding protein
MTTKPALTTLLACLLCAAAPAQTPYADGQQAITAARALQTDKPAEAAMAYLAMARKYPAHESADDALYYAAVNFAQAQQYDKALECLDKAVTDYPQSSLYLSALNLQASYLYSHLKDYAKAGPIYEKLALEMPGYVSAESAAGQALQSYRAVKDHESVIRLADAYAKINPPTGSRVLDLLRYKGMALLDLGRPDDAAAVVEAIAAISPTSRYGGELAYNIGRYHTDKQDHEKAARLYTRVGKFTDYEYAATYAYTGAQAYERVQPPSRSDAIKAFREFIAAFPLDQRVHEATWRIAELHRAEKQIDEQIQVLKEFLEKNPNSVVADRAVWSLAAAYMAQNKAPLARRYYQMLMDKHPKSEYTDDAMFAIAQMMQREKHLDGARMLYEKIIATRPMSSSADRAAQQLAAIKK